MNSFLISCKRFMFSLFLDLRTVFRCLQIWIFMYSRLTIASCCLCSSLISSDSRNEVYDVLMKAFLSRRSCISDSLVLALSLESSFLFFSDSRNEVYDSVMKVLSRRSCISDSLILAPSLESPSLISSMSFMFWLLLNLTISFRILAVWNSVYSRLAIASFSLTSLVNGVRYDSYCWFRSSARVICLLPSIRLKVFMGVFSFLCEVLFSHNRRWLF